MAKVGRPRARQGELARGAPKRNARRVGKMGAQTHEEPYRKQPHKGALGKRASRRTDKNQFWLGGRFVYTAWPSFGNPEFSPHLGGFPRSPASETPNFPRTWAVSPAAQLRKPR